MKIAVLAVILVTLTYVSAHNANRHEDSTVSRWGWLQNRFNSETWNRVRQQFSRENVRNMLQSINLPSLNDLKEMAPAMRESIKNGAKKWGNYFTEQINQE